MRLPLLTACLVVLAACASGEGAGGVDAGSDAGRDATADAMPDAGPVDPGAPADADAGTPDDVATDPGPADPGPGDAGPRPFDWPGLAVEIDDDPLTLRFLWEGDEVAVVGGPDAAGLYITETGIDLRPTGPARWTWGDRAVTLAWTLADGRPLDVVVRAIEEGAVQVEVRTSTLGDWETFGVDLAAAPDEAFYGVTERVSFTMFQDDSWKPGTTLGLDLRGQDGDLMIYPTVSAYSPFFVSSKGYGVHVAEDWIGRYFFGTRDPDRVVLWYESDPANPSLTFRVLPGPTPLAVTERYSRIVGTTLLPPKWTFGPWRWRDNHHDLPAFYDGTPYDGPFNSMIVEDVLMMAHFGIPCTLYWVDRPWATGSFGYDDFEWDTGRLPDPVDMVRWLNGRGIEFMLWIAPWADGDMHQEAVEKGYDVDLQFGDDSVTLLDLTNPDAVSWWQDAMIETVIADGVRGFKGDRGEERVPDGRLATGFYHDGTSYREGRNRFPYLYAKAVRGAFERAGLADASVVMLRAGWQGSSRHAILWGGDTAATQWGLRSAIIAVQRAAVMNFPIWGSDTCGYGNDHATSETCMRWMQFSAFTPLMEVGPTADAAPWSWRAEGDKGKVGSSGYGYTPHYDADMIATWILYANLHMDLIDYTWAQAVAAHERGTPIVRPMIFMFPDRPEYRDLWDQYLYGPDLLVAPVWAEGTTTRQVHIPEGAWIDAWTGEEMTPGSVVDVAVPRHKIPIYVRKDSGIDLGDLDARWADAQARAADVPDLAELAADVAIPAGDPSGRRR